MSKLVILLTLLPLLPFFCKSFSLDKPLDRRILVLLNDFAIKSSHSLFFNSLQSRDFDLDFKLADDPKARNNAWILIFGSLGMSSNRFFRSAMQKVGSPTKRGRYFTSFKVPDVYGAFQFKVEYQKLGIFKLISFKADILRQKFLPGHPIIWITKADIFVQLKIPVRPFRHNEYERFIPAAFPYYGAAFSMMAGFFIFAAVHLYSK